LIFGFYFGWLQLLCVNQLWMPFYMHKSHFWQDQLPRMLTDYYCFRLFFAGDGLDFQEVKRHSDNDGFWKNSIFACQHHDGFRGINSSDFFQTFTSCCHLFFEASRLCPVQFRLKVMNSQSFSISMNIVAHNDMILFARGQRMGPMLALTFSFYSPLSSRCYAFLDGLNPLKTHGETQETAAIQRYDPTFPW
jgi:hypothetical protein